MWGCYNGKLVDEATAQTLSQQPVFQSGRSLIETMRWENGALALSPYHWNRLFAGMHCLDYRTPATFDECLLTAQIATVIAANNASGALKIRLQLAPPDAAGHPPQFLLQIFPLPPAQPALIAGIAQNVYKRPHFLSQLKTGDRQVYALAALTAAHHGWDEALICNEAGRVIESTIANIFWVEDGQLFTPPLTEGCVAGVMRAFLLEKLPALGYPVREESLSMERLSVADEVFLSNALRGLRPVIEIAGTKAYEGYFCAQFSKYLSHL